MATNLPYAVTPFENTSGTISFRVSGSWKGERIRKNFPDRVSADTFCNAKNAEALKAVTATPRHIVQTRLREADLHAAESGVDKIAGRWSLAKVIEAGVAALENAPSDELVAPLAEEWFAIVEGEVGWDWFTDLRARVRRFLADHPKLTTAHWSRAVTRKWLDGLRTESGAPMEKNSRANMRNAVHRFAAWLVDSGKLNENPAAGIRVTGRVSGAKLADKPLPPVFTPAQAEALLYACQLGVCRRILGWTASCLFVGLRPNSEAPRARWTDINFETGEWSVLGRKRGAKLRIIPLTPAAIAWLRVVKADAMDRPAFFSKRAMYKAVELANAWLAEQHPCEKPITWSEDVTRHTFASCRAALIPLHKLAEEMGNSVGTIYGYYRHPRPAAQVKAFWALRPRRSMVEPLPALPGRRAALQ